MKCKYIQSFLLPGILLLGAVSCHREETPAQEAVSPRAPRGFSVSVDEIRETPGTKSALTADDIETRISDVTLAVYNDQTGERCCDPVYVTSGFDNISFQLDPVESVTAYALANMGDMRAAFPSTYSETALQAITYRIPAYTEGESGLNGRGLPMAGTLTCSEDDGLPAVIPLQRLLAKLQTTLSCEWPGKIISVKVYNLNAVLHPFGVSAATSADDLLAEQEICVIDPAGVSSGEFVFYVPENRQGTVAGIGASAGKSYDNEALGARKELASYLETVVCGEPAQGASGTLTYRSYLGGDSTTDFNITRNSRYLWEIRFLPGNMQKNDWKHVNALSWKEFTYLFSAPDYVYLGQNTSCILYRNANNYQNGTFVGITYGETLPSVTYSVSPANQTVLTDFSLFDPFFYFTGNQAGTATVTATAVDPYHPAGTSFSKQVRVLNYKREYFIRTPSGDYYPGNVIPVPFGTTWSNLQLGMKKTLANGTVQTICPVVCGQDNLTSVFVEYGTSSSSNPKLFEYATYKGDTGKSATFGVSFNSAGNAWSQPNFYVFLYYQDYEDKAQSLSGRIYADVLDTDTEILNLTCDRESAYWTNQSIAFSASSTAIHNGTAGSQTDITGSGNYTWTATGSVPGMNPQLVLSGNRRVLTASKSGTVTVSVSRNGAGGISASQSVTFNDRISYRLAVSPKAKSVQAGSSFSTQDFIAYQDKYVNGAYAYREIYTGLLHWTVKSGSAPYLDISGTTVHAKAVGTGTLVATTYHSLMESGYSQEEITVSIGQADHFAVSLSPASVSLKEEESAPALSFSVTNNGAAIGGLTATDLTWHTESSTIATVSPTGIVTGNKKGSTRIYATYADATSNKITVTVQAKKADPPGGGGITANGGVEGAWGDGGEIDL